MDFRKIRASLQDLIIRLQDAEKGFKKVAEETQEPFLRNNFERLASERHRMHQALELHSRNMGGDPEVKTSFLGGLHRMFMNIKFGVGADNTDQIIEEVKRGSNTLLEDYERVMKEIQLPENILATLMSQKVSIKNDLSEIISWAPNVTA